ncbi:tetratricopeptide(TPR) protein [Angomonas deanei]|nr:tetratricopeptide(TPR) protein [Angomonas deanei]|eukprot:EPY38153.1 tetratricopeptide(TPR) protein [Angomonas deanei]
MPPKAKAKRSSSKSAKAKEKKERQELEERMKNCEEKCTEAKNFMEPTGKNATPNYVKAKSSLDAAMEFYNSNPQVFFLLGELYRKQNMFSEAVVEYSHALDLNPTFTQALESRGACYQKLAQLPLAIEDFTSVIEIEPSNDHAYNMRGLCITMGRVPGLSLRTDEFSSCEEDFRNAVRLNPANYYAFVNLAKAYEGQGDLEKALECYNASLLIKKDYTYAIFRRGCVEMRLGENFLKRDSDSDVEDNFFVPHLGGVDQQEKGGAPRETYNDVEKEIRNKISEEETTKKGKSMLDLAIKDFNSLVLEEQKLSTDVMVFLNLGICHLKLEDLNQAEDNF